MEKHYYVDGLTGKKVDEETNNAAVAKAYYFLELPSNLWKTEEIPAETWVAYLVDSPSGKQVGFMYFNNSIDFILARFILLKDTKLGTNVIGWYPMGE